MKILSWFRALQGTHLNSEQLSAYLDGQVRPDERRRLEAHLAACEACRRELAGLRQTVALVRTLPRVPVPRAFTLSQAQVGLARPVGRPGWLGPALAGLAATTTVVFVLVAATVLWRRTDRQSVYELARLSAPSAATAAVAERPVEIPSGRAVAPAAVPAPQEGVAAEKAPAATAARAPAQAATGPTATPAVVAPAAPTRPPVAAAPARPTATAAPVRPATPVPAPPTAEKPAALAAAAAATPPSPAASAATPAPVAPAAAREIGPAVPAAGGPAADEKAAETLAPAEANPAALPADAAVAFAVAGGLWTLDRQAGLRRVAQADGLAAPVASDDRAWIAYRRPGRGGVEVWAVPWAAGAPRPIVSEESLNEGLLAGYQPRRIEEVRWVPGRHLLAVTTSAAARTPGVAPRFELWLFGVDPVVGRLAASGDLIQRPVAAADGAFFVFLRRVPDRPTEGQVWLVPTDGGPERAVLRFPLPADASRVALPIGWLPDGSAFRVAVAEAETSGLRLYQVEVQEGSARAIGHVDGSEAFWSADAGRLAYVRPAGGAAGPAELFVADGLGAEAHQYATLTRGRFVAWSADAARFLYEDDGHLFVGAIGQPALRLASAAAEARWLGSDAVLYVVRQAAYRQLVYHPLAGRPIVLYNVAADVSFDGIWPW